MYRKYIAPFSMALMFMAMLACAAEKSNREATDLDAKSPVSRIEPELFAPGGAVVGCSCIMRPAGETAEPGKCIYAEQVGTPEVRFVLMQWNGQLLRFAVDSSWYNNSAGLRETQFSGNGYRGEAQFKETTRTDTIVRTHVGNITLSPIDRPEAAVTILVEGPCAC